MIRRQNQNEAPRRAPLYAMNSQLKPPGEIHALQVLVDRSTTYYLEYGYIVSHNQLYSEVRAERADCDRPELARLGEAVLQGCIFVVMVSSFDRLALGSAESVTLVEEFKAAGVTTEIAGK